jgi:hypothetical protein
MKSWESADDSIWKLRPNSGATSSRSLTSVISNGQRAPTDSGAEINGDLVEVDSIVKGQDIMSYDRNHHQSLS